jgi:hypothetical protein
VITQKNEDMKNKTEKRKPDEQTPIIDGDARPDKHIEESSSKAQSIKDKEKFTPERKRDVNSLEDYKDEK